MKTINHQFINKSFFVSPNWDVKHLFIGTFNPEGGDKVNYFYGRQKNCFWKILTIIFEENFDPNSNNFFELLKKHGIACVDIIQSVNKIDDNDFTETEINKILGQGYSDSKIINNSFKRLYNTEAISKFISLNNCYVYSTWGTGSSLKNWKNEINKINFTSNLVSPSLAARVPKGVAKFEFMLNDWRSKIHL